MKNKQQPQSLLVISGASRGIGYATARRFMDGDYAVVNLSRSPCPLSGVKNLFADFADPGWPEALEEELRSLQRAYSTTCIVHNSAFQISDTCADTSLEALERMLRINVMAPARLNQILLPAMSTGSSILYVGSTLSTRATRAMSSYTTCKHALIGQMRSLCIDCKGRGIHSASVCPGYTNTEMLREYAGDVLELLADRAAMERLAEPSEVAECLHFCAQNPIVNGGVVQADLGLLSD